MIHKLTDSLLTDGGGKIQYKPFIFYLHNLCSSINKDQQSIIHQIINNSIDVSGTIIPLRNWLIRNIDTESLLITPKEFNSLLREFSVIYKADDLDFFRINLSKCFDTYDKLDAHKTVIDCRDFLSQVLNNRPNWTMNHPALCKKIQSYLRAPQHAEKTNQNSIKVIGLETVLVKQIMTRLHAFGIESIGANGSNGELMIDKDIFANVVRTMGIPLSDQDLLCLADATDCCPGANRIRINVLLESLLSESRNDFDSGKSSYYLNKKDLSDAEIFALEHIRNLIWKNEALNDRSYKEWIADVTTVFHGFDYSDCGYIAVEDFQTVL
jgi:hypothetical protein